MLNLFGLGKKQKKITPARAKKELDTDKDIVLIDVRTEQEYKDEHIPDSMLIPLDQLSTNIATKVPEKDRKIFVYCRSGARSTSAAKILGKMGYTNVFNLGGIIAWPYEKE